MTRQRLTHTCKVVLAHALYFTGLLRVWQFIALRNRAVVLMYHRVLSDDERRRTGSHPGIIVSSETFARQMALLKQRFQVLTSQQFAHHLTERHPLPHSSCVITFDDGWRDNLTAAVPVLRQLQLPALIFLPVNFIGRRRLFWREALTHLLVDAVRSARKDTGLRSRIASALESAGLAGVLDLAGDPQAGVVEAVGASRLTASSAQRLTQEVEAALPRPVDLSNTPDAFVTWDQVREMGASGISFGGHGVEHRLLAELSSTEADFEVREAMRVLSGYLATPVLSFSYPNGSQTPAVREMVKAAGYQMAFTTEPGLVESRHDRFMIRRVNVHEDMTNSTPMFLARILGLF